MKMSKRRKPRNVAPTFILVGKNAAATNLTTLGDKEGFSIPETLLLMLKLASAFVLFTPSFVVEEPEVWYCDGRPLFNGDICSCEGSLSPELESASIVAEWNLVCDAAWVQNFVVSAQMLGMLFGSLLAIKLSDWYGLGGRSMLRDTLLIMGAGHLLSAAAIDPYSYSICRFIAGIGLAGLLGIPCGNYAEEFVVPEWRPLCGTVTSLTGGLGVLILISKYFSSWRVLTLVTSIQFVHIAVMLHQLPKSPSWYAVRFPKKMQSKAMPVASSKEFTPYIAKLIAKSRKPPQLLFAEIPKLQDTGSSGIRSSEEENGRGSSGSGPKGFSYLDFFTNRNLRFATIYQMTITCLVEVAFYGLCFSLKIIKDYHANFFTTAALLVVVVIVELIGFGVGLSYYYRVGSRKAVLVFSISAGMLFGVLAVLQVIAEPLPTLWVVGFLMICKCCISASQCCAHIVLCEVYPAGNVRMMGSQLRAIATSVGALMAVQLVSLGSDWPSVPYFAFAVVSLAGGLFSFLTSESKYASMMPYYPITYFDIDPTYVSPLPLPFNDAVPSYL